MLTLDCGSETVCGLQTKILATKLMLHSKVIMRFRIASLPWYAASRELNFQLVHSLPFVHLLAFCRSCLQSIQKGRLQTLTLPQMTKKSNMFNPPLMEVMEVSKVHDLCTIMYRTDLCFKKIATWWQEQSSVTHTQDFYGKNEQKLPDFKEIVLKSPYVDNRFQQVARI
jgi:hypothetical protein